MKVQVLIFGCFLYFDCILLCFSQQFFKKEILSSNVERNPKYLASLKQAPNILIKYTVGTATSKSK